MKRTVKMMVAGLLFSSSAAFAAGGGNPEGGMLVYCFLGFFALVIAFQLVPGLILFFTMINEFFSRPSKTAGATAEAANSRNTEV